MELEQVQDLLTDIPSTQQKSITSLIDLKTNDNMKEVLTAINGLRSDMDAKFSAIDSKFSAIDSKFSAMDSKFNSIDMRLKTLYWVVGVCVVPILLYIFKSFI